MFIGGEFYEDSTWATASPAPPIADAIFLNGGRACLSVIADYLISKKIDQILLPAYLCPSILDVFDQKEIRYSFYKIEEDLSIDLDELLEKASKFQAIYFINYYGFQQSAETLQILKQLQAAGKLLVEDNAQSGIFSNFIGDFCFNSIRKVCGSDGGYLATRNMFVNETWIQFSSLNNRLPLIREYRHRLREYLFENRGTREELDHLFYQAERLYEQDNVILGDPDERNMIEHLDWQSIKTARRTNYAYLLNQISNLHGLSPLFPNLQDDIMPFGLPVYISGVSRDALIEKLAEESISLTVHWDALLSDTRTINNSAVTNIAGKILTLPIDQYTSKSQLDYLVSQIFETIKLLS
ncbi:MAG: hypothetical protein CVU42_11885 [Chloroflexi bacterium HGW-Chloroflexi-4]|jgi:dTDP-4-amino-4,6-dideoxygalactose transaminase|nr:MAG: hypothetical protein CVV01_02165 [Firmicutes bacterium HGW-Firmicutes-6]PKN98515.1 MAG: hypothetical protein CVU42_11885 [Chloroflexi bacterium HGW-Chloroflexi-4]